MGKHQEVALRKAFDYGTCKINQNHGLIVVYLRIEAKLYAGDFVNSSNIVLLCSLGNILG